MKILLVNRYAYMRGGDCRYFFNLTDLLRAQGHEVIHYSMQHPRNFASPYAAWFAPYIDFPEQMARGTPAAAMRVLRTVLYNYQAARQIRQLVQRERPVVAHLNNFHHHLSVAILFALKQLGIPIVWTMHDYSLICPNDLLLRNGQICEACRGKRFLMAFLLRCKKRSWAASLVTGLEGYCNHLLRAYRCVNQFIAPSHFLGTKLIQHGLAPHRIITLPNFMPLSKCQAHYGHQGYILYLGRLSREKGLTTLLRAFAQLEGATLYLAGEGPQKSFLQSFVQRHNIPRVRFLGFVAGDSLRRLIQRAIFLVVPSEWYENFPYTTLEAFGCGKPVIAARIGGLPEQVIEGRTGLLFTPGDADNLAQQMKYLLDHPQQCRQMGAQAHAMVKTQFGPTAHYQRLMAIYQKVLAHRRLRRP